MIPGPGLLPPAWRLPRRIAEAAAALPAPCFIFDRAALRDNIRRATEAGGIFRSFSLGYSVKTNSLPDALTTARRCGCRAEVVSADEYMLARGCGFPDKDIIYNGPLKSPDTFRQAVRSGATVNIETHREIDWLASMPGLSGARVGVRVNINTARMAPGCMAPGELAESRFGFSFESGELAEAVSRINAMEGVRVAGLHLHRTTRLRLPDYYRSLALYAARIAAELQLAPEYIDFGGGYFGGLPGKPGFPVYAQAIRDGLAGSALEDTEIILEPGHALLAEPFCFLTEVIDVKEADGLRFVTLDGSRNDIDPLFRKTSHFRQILLRSGDRPVSPRQIVGGCSCMEDDRFFELLDEPELRVGDRILFTHEGAYTLTLSGLFIRFFPAVYAVDCDGAPKLVREPWTADKILTDR